MSERRIVVCSTGHRSTVPADAYSNGVAATHACPVCGLGVPKERTETAPSEHGGLRREVLPPPRPKIGTWQHALWEALDFVEDAIKLWPTGSLEHENAMAVLQRCHAALQGASEEPAANAQQLVARIKRSSKYWGQTRPNEWFAVNVIGGDNYPLRGNSNNYRLADVALGVRVDDGSVVEIKR